MTPCSLERTRRDALQSPIALCGTTVPRRVHHTREEVGVTSSDRVAKDDGIPLRVRNIGVVGFIAVSRLSEFQVHRYLMRVPKVFLRTQ
jgi:uncharacterized protein (UPF0303 family)